MTQLLATEPLHDREADETHIVDRIFNAVMERRLPPGTKLPEVALGEIFGVRRMRIRRALLLLASQQIVELQSNRGAFVASPTGKEARDVFEARLSIEPDVARLAVLRATSADIAKLKQQLKQETRALRAGDRHRAIRLSGEFHVQLASLSNNQVLLRTMRELTIRTSLIIGLYGAPDTSNCHDNEHQLIVQALSDRDTRLVARLMKEHLRHIERDLDFSVRTAPAMDLQLALSGHAV